MELLAWILSIIVALWLGWHLREIRELTQYLKQAIQSKVEKKPEPEKSTSTIIDPSDPIQTAQYEHRKLMEKMNPQDE